MANATNHITEDIINLQKDILRKLKQVRSYLNGIIAELEGLAYETINQSRKLKNARRKSIKNDIKANRQ